MASVSSRSAASTSPAERCANARAHMAPARTPNVAARISVRRCVGRRNHRGSHVAERNGDPRGERRAPRLQRPRQRRGASIERVGSFGVAAAPPQAAAHGERRAAGPGGVAERPRGGGRGRRECLRIRRAVRDRSTLRRRASRDRSPHRRGLRAPPTAPHRRSACVRRPDGRAAAAPTRDGRCAAAASIQAPRRASAAIAWRSSRMPGA